MSSKYLCLINRSPIEGKETLHSLIYAILKLTSCATWQNGNWRIFTSLKCHMRKRTHAY